MWKPDCHITYRKLICIDGRWRLHKKNHVTCINESLDWRKKDSQKIDFVLPEPNFQHPYVICNKPYFYNFWK